jgi:hypothetical protein
MSPSEGTFVDGEPQYMHFKVSTGAMMFINIGLTTVLCRNLQ